jgi:hypothetical protein
MVVGRAVAGADVRIRRHRQALRHQVPRRAEGQAAAVEAETAEGTAVVADHGVGQDAKGRQ